MSHSTVKYLILLIQITACIGYDKIHAIRSNAIEDSTLTLRETQLILEQGITIGSKSLREHFEIINHQDAIKSVGSLAVKQEPITINWLLFIRLLTATAVPPV